MVKYTNLSPRDIEALAEKAKTKIKDPTLKVVIDGDKIIKNSQESKASRLLSIGNNRRKKSFKKTIKQVQSDLPILSRLFSKLIHINIIEEASNLLGRTIFKPNPILIGAFVAFVVTIFNYILVKQYNYELSGYESIIAFTSGWIIGLLYDYLKVLFTGKNN